MAKFGYLCKCGWYLKRKHKTRIEYALEKQNHALGITWGDQVNLKPCHFLAAELAITQKDTDLKGQLLQAAKA